MKAPLHTAVETPTYILSAKRAGLLDVERDAVLDRLMIDPSSGDLIRESGGIRKVRVGKNDGGKSGGYRVLTYFMDHGSPVFLLLVIDKVEADNITAKQKKQLRDMAKHIKQERDAETLAR